MDINKHIVENLNHYLKAEDPEYAFLISGDWGSGKTHFIDAFITRYAIKTEKIIKVSLFGLNTSADIDEKVFQELHPILGSKHAKFAGSLLKSAIRLGVKVDINSDGKADSSIASNWDKVNFSDYFTKGKENKKIIIILDDLERTNIPTAEILGYINYLVEISKVKIILIANEQKMLEKSKRSEGTESADYEEFKEKVIGKTFQVKHNFDEVLSAFLDNEASSNLREYSHVIKDVYVRSGCNNLRKLKQSILDFNYLSENIKSEYSNVPAFYTSLIKIFFALNMEVKGGTLNESDLRNNTPFKYIPKPVTSAQMVFTKYSFSKDYLYSGNIWADMIFKGNIENIDKLTSKLAFFITKEDKKQPAWVRLWNFRELEHVDFKVLIEEIKNDILSLKEELLPIYFHKLALIIYFHKNKLIDIELPIINQAVDGYIGKYESSDHWKTQSFSGSSFANGTGYTYMNYEDEDFIKLNTLISNRSKKVYAEQKIKTEINDSLLLISNIETGDLEAIINMLLHDYQYHPIFHNISPDTFVEKLLVSKNKTLSKFNDVIFERFSDNHTYNNMTPSFYLSKELEFWRSLSLSLKIKLVGERDIKIHNLELFLEHTVSIVIQKLAPEGVIDTESVRNNISKQAIITD